jgi:hypothetical protein
VTFVIKGGLVVRVLVLVADVALLGDEHGWQVDLIEERKGAVRQPSARERMADARTFSNFIFIGFGLRAVIASAISCPMRKASSLDLPGMWMKSESVSP